MAVNSTMCDANFPLQHEMLLIDAPALTQAKEEKERGASLMLGRPVKSIGPLVGRGKLREIKLRVMTWSPAASVSALVGPRTRSRTVGPQSANHGHGGCDLVSPRTN